MSIQRIHSTTVVTSVLVMSAMASASPAQAQVSACNRLIELSKLRNEAVTNSQSFAQYQKDFCNDYQSYKSTGKAMSAGGKYGPISANFGQSSSSVDAIATRYCESDGSVKSTADAYREYVEAIAPGAYESYNNCISLGNNNINFTLPPTAIQPTNATFMVSNADPNTNAFDDIRYQAAPGISCQWDSGKAGDLVRLNGRHSATLNCSRPTATAPGYVMMYAATLPNSAVTVAWDEYQNGVPVSVVKQLQAATADLTALKNSLKGAVVSFNSGTCPAGWVPYVPAQGRFVRGIDPTGDRSVDPDGTRTPGNIQADDIRTHTHSYVEMIADNNVDGVDSTAQHSGEHHNEARDTKPFGGAETRPKNVALLYCQPQ